MGVRGDSRHLIRDYAVTTCADGGLCEACSRRVARRQGVRRAGRMARGAGQNGAKAFENRFFRKNLHLCDEKGENERPLLNCACSRLAAGASCVGGRKRHSKMQEERGSS